MADCAELAKLEIITFTRGLGTAAGLHFGTIYIEKHPEVKDNQVRLLHTKIGLLTLDAFAASRSLCNSCCSSLHSF